MWGDVQMPCVTAVLLLHDIKAATHDCVSLWHTCMWHHDSVSGTPLGNHWTDKNNGINK